MYVENGWARGALILVMAIALSACASLSTISVGNQDRQALRYSCVGDLEHEVRELANPLVDSGRTPGVVVGVLTPDGNEHFYGYGRASSSTVGPPGPDTISAVGSITKGLVGAVAENMVERGSLSWGDTLEELLPKEVELSDDARKITLRQLATHTSGLPRQPMTFETFRLFMQYLVTGKDFYRRLDKARAYDLLKGWKRDTRPNATDRRYSNVGYALLASILEDKSGYSISTLIENNVTQPLNMTATTFTPEALASTYARSIGHAGDQPKFIKRGKPVADWRMNPFMLGAGGAYSTPRDLIRYAGSHFSATPTKIHSTMIKTLDNEQPSVAWLDDPLREEGIYYQFGVNSGHSAFVGIDVNRRIAVVALHNSFNWSDDVGRNLLRRLGRAEDLKKTLDHANCAAAYSADMGAHAIPAN